MEGGDEANANGVAEKRRGGGCDGAEQAPAGNQQQGQGAAADGRRRLATDSFFSRCDITRMVPSGASVTWRKMRYRQQRSADAPDAKPGSA